MADPYAALGEPVDPYAAIAEPATDQVVGQSHNGGVTISVEKPQGIVANLAGAAATLNRSIPFVDEASDAARAFLQTGADLATGKAHLQPEVGKTALQSASDIIRQHYLANQARTAALAQGFETAHPVASDLVKGAGMAVQAVPAMATAGASAVPEITASAAPARGLLAASARALKPGADSAVTAGLAAQVNGLGSDGTLRRRLQNANEATVPAMAIGAALPPALFVGSKLRQAATGALGKTGQTIARVANKMSGGTILDPEQEAMGRLAAALRQDGLSPSDIHSALDAWQESGASAPALLDLAGENTRALLRNVAAEPGAARNLAVQYAKGVEGGLQENVMNRTGALTPDARTLPEIEGNIAGRIGSASAFTPPAAGSGGAAVHQALNDAFDTAKAGVDQAYGAARAADPQAAHIPSAELPNIAASVRDAVSDFAPEDVPRVARALGTLDTTSTPTVRDLFELRSRLSNLRASNDLVEAKAAGAATRALDAQIDDVADKGLITGDPIVVDLWRNAISARRAFGQQFEGNDLIQRLTQRGLYGEGRTNLVAPEDASSAILGRVGVSPRQNLARDLARLRDTLGANSPAWRALQGEAFARIAGKDAGTEDFGQAWRSFVQQNPGVASLITPPGQSAMLSKAQDSIANAVADRKALGVGQSVIGSNPDRFAVDVANIGDRAPLAQAGAVRDIQDQVGRPKAGATGLLNRLATGPNTSRNLDKLFGPRRAEQYRDAIQREISRVENARFVNPNAGPKTANVILDALVNPPADIPVTKVGALKAILGKIVRGASLTDPEREALVRLATTRVRTGADVPQIPTVGGGTMRLTPAQRARFARLLATGTGAATAAAQ